MDLGHSPSRAQVLLIQCESFAAAVDACERIAGGQVVASDDGDVFPTDEENWFHPVGVVLPMEQFWNNFVTRAYHAGYAAGLESLPVPEVQQRLHLTARVRQWWLGVRLAIAKWWLPEVFQSEVTT